LVNAEPGNGNRQWALWAWHVLIGNVLHDQGNLAAALPSYTTARAIAERFGTMEPGNAVWQRNLAWTYASVAAVQRAKGDRAGALALWRKALAIVEASASAIEQEEIKNAGRPGAKTAEALRWVGSQALLARDFSKLLAASERARVLAPDLVWPDALRAHALLFRNRTREARALYLSNKGQGKFIDGRPWERAIADDFRLLRRAGLAHAMMPQIETALGITPRTPAVTARGR
jgi:tetratricopeptide (TPR) repeat protein